MVQTIPVTPGKDYTVRAGDSLWSIAVRAYGSGVDWPIIYDANQQTIGKNPGLIIPGQVLHIPVITTPPQPQPALPLKVSTEIQGDILAGFNKDHRLYIFLQFPDQRNGRAWLKDLIPFIADTKQVAAFNKFFKDASHAAGGKDPANLRATWVNVSFTFDGLKILLKADPTNALRNILHADSFVLGARDGKVLGKNGDTDASSPDHWVVGKAKQTIHALLNIQADDPDDLAAEVQKLKALAAQHYLTIVFEQLGATLPGDLKGHEHFGYKDGISQPGVEGFDVPELAGVDADAAAKLGDVPGNPGREVIRAGEFILGKLDESGQPVQSLGELDWMKNGSFQVFRRLNQDVPGFNEQEQKNLGTLRPDDPLRGRIGALLVGRWKSGTPVDLSPDTDNELLGDDVVNNFNFSARKVGSIDVADDPQGARCPVTAHIRKVYPRHNGDFDNRIRRIIRRGVPFGNPFDLNRGAGFDAKAERGLIFVAYMSNIAEKFEFLMQTWVNNAGFPHTSAGPDPIIGESRPPAPITVAHPGEDVSAIFHRKVQTTGSVYAFVPAISALKGLADGTL